MKLIFILLFSLGAFAQVPNNEVPFNTAYFIEGVKLDSTLVIMSSSSFLSIKNLKGTGTFAFRQFKTDTVRPVLKIAKCTQPFEVRVHPNIKLILGASCKVKDTITVGKCD